jgi:hypothetical protein
MMVKKTPYKSDKEYLFLDQKRQMKLVARIKRQIAKFDFQPEQLGFLNTRLLTPIFDVSQESSPTRQPVFIREFIMTIKLPEF